MLNAFGLRNTGVTCYFNSLLQGLLSCDRLTNVMLKNYKEYKSNIVASKYIELIIKSQNNENVENMASEIYQAMINHLQSTTQYPSFGRGQEDTHEAYLMLMECWSDLVEVQRLFIHKSLVSYFCLECKQWNINDLKKININQPNEKCFCGAPAFYAKDFDYRPNYCETHAPIKYQDTYNPYVLTNTYIEVSPILRSELPPNMNQILHINSREDGTLRSFLLRQNAKNTGLKCKQCESKNDKIRAIRTRRLPDIIVCVCMKYNKKINTPFPETIEINEKLKYKVVAQMLHSGNIHGGHYWAHCIRHDGWYNLNDQSVNRISQFNSLPETYIVFYEKTI